MPALRCPWCKALSQFGLQASYAGQGEGAGVTYGMWMCTNCSRPIVGVVGGEGGQQVPHDYHPQDIPDPGFPDVPRSIAGDAKEAFQVFAIECWSASAAMARRALQAAAYDKGAPEGRLIEQIDWLADNGHITDQMRQVAHRIRLGGNLGAHPDRDGLRDLGKLEVQALLEFLQDFLRYVYELPARLDRLAPGADGQSQEG